MKEIRPPRERARAPDTMDQSAKNRGRLWIRSEGLASQHNMGRPKSQRIIDARCLDAGRKISGGQWNDASHGSDAVEREALARLVLWGGGGPLLRHHGHAIGVHRHRCRNSHRDRPTRISSLSAKKADQGSQKKQRGENACHDIMLLAQRLARANRCLKANARHSNSTSLCHHLAVNKFDNNSYVKSIT